MIKENPECVKFEGYNNETPLHQAVGNGHLEAAKAILAFTTEPEIATAYVNTK